MEKNQIFRCALIHVLAGLMVSFNFLSCSNEMDEDGARSKADDTAKYDEANYPFTTIELWGSEAAVVDAGDYYIFQGDIHIAKQDLENPKTRGAGVLNRRWPDNKIYYTLSGMTNAASQAFSDALSYIEERSYLKFVPRLENEKNYIKFTFINSSTWEASSDYIGMKGGEQNIKLSTEAWRKGTIVHEICHAIGMYHEQCRADRNNFVRIDFSTMSSGDRHQFKTYVELGENGKDFGSYDFNSIMHYGSWIVDGDVEREVMWKLDGSVIYAQRYYLSAGDIATLAALQPGTIGYGTFYDPLGHNLPYDGAYECRRSKYLRLPEGAKIGFRLQYMYNPSSSKLSGYSINDFKMNLEVSIVNKDTSAEVYTKTIPLTQASSYVDSYIPEITIPSGLYTATIRLVGSVNGTSDPGKLSVLSSLMYDPMVYLHLNSFRVNNSSLVIPSAYGYDASLRRLTFVSIE